MYLKVSHISIYYILAILFLVSSCKTYSSKKQQANKNESPNELIVYCENAMIPPLLELKESFEKEQNCHIKIQNDCSQNLIGLIDYSKKGDLFLPGSNVAFKELRKQSSITITDSAFLGYNRLVFMVKKGNPSNFNGDLNTLTSPNTALIMANPETSTLGYETRTALKQQKIYDAVLKNVVALTTDSKGLVKSLKNDQANLVINWESSIHLNGSKRYVDIVPFHSQNEYYSEVYAGVLSCSSNPQLAQSFLTMVNNAKGKSILRKYGFSKRKTLIF
jgi:molybdate transport system substrate-binding protein